MIYTYYELQLYILYFRGDITMNSHLKKLGLSDTKFQLKYHTPKCSQKGQISKESSSKPQYTHDENGTVLDVLVELIGRKQRESCPLQDHDRNPIKFLCLEENCPIKAGCSYCFLDGHKGHSKMQSRTCLKDLLELQQRSQISRSLLRSELTIRKQQLLEKISRQVNIIKEQFLSNLQYMNKKIKQSIEAKFQDCCSKFSHEGREQFYSNAIDKQDTFREFDAEKSTEGNDIISKFMLSSFSSKQADQKPAIRSISKYPLKRDSTPHRSLTRQDEHQLLGKLSRLNLTFAEEYIKHETAHLKEFVGGFRIYEQFYTELNSSLSEFLAAFKRAMPSLKAFELGLQEPQVLQAFPQR